MPKNKEEVRGPVQQGQEATPVEDIISTIASITAPPRPVSDHSIMAKLLPLEQHPAVMIYGPSKTGKTRFAVWEGAALASVLNRRMLAIFTESNMEEYDFADLLSICMYHNVNCELVKLDHLQGIRKYIKKFNNTIMRKAAKKPEELKTMPRVVVIDSLTALSELVTSSLSDGLLENPQSLIAYQNPFQIAVIDPIRRVLSHHLLDGFLIVTAHETQTRGEAYNPGVTRVKAKPRYTSAGRYKEDAEIYFTNAVDEYEDMFGCTAGRDAKKAGGKRFLRVMVVVRARRAPDKEGTAISLALERVEGTARGTIEVAEEPGKVSYVYTPEDMVSGTTKTYKYSALVPRVLCGPRKII